MTTAPLITIGLTCFNASQTIARALESALSQDWSNFEIVVVDDCSTDDSSSIIREAITDHGRARLIVHGQNSGAAAARNTILQEAKGEFIAFFDDDDTSYPERIRLQLERLLAYEQETEVHRVACYASGTRRYPNGYEMRIEAIGSRKNVPHGDVVTDYLLFNSRKPGVFYGAGTPTCSLMARRKTLLELGGFDETLRRVEDIDLAIRLACSGGHFIGCPEQLFLQYATTASDKTPRKNLDAELRLIEKHAEYLRQRSRYEYAKAWFVIRFYHFSGQRLKLLLALTLFLLRHPIHGISHLMRALPARWLHERRMNQSSEAAQ